MRSELAVLSRDVIRYCCAGFAKISVSIIRHPLRFQISKKTFHPAVIPAFPRPDISHITTTDLIRFCYSKLAFQIIGDLNVLLRRLLISMLRLLTADEIEIFHQAVARQRLSFTPLTVTFTAILRASAEPLLGVVLIEYWPGGFEAKLGAKNASVIELLPILCHHVSILLPPGNRYVFLVLFCKYIVNSSLKISW